MTGIYSITNNKTKQFYIGSSHRIESRFIVHRRLLKKGLHHNRRLQRSYDRDGESSFVFECIEETSPENLLRLEDIYLTKYWSSGLLYNFSKYATAPMRGKTLTTEQKKAIGIATSIALRGKPSNALGCKRSDEMKKRISETVKRKIASGEIRRIAWNKGMRKGVISQL